MHSEIEEPAKESEAPCLSGSERIGDEQIRCAAIRRRPGAGEVHCSSSASRETGEQLRANTGDNGGSRADQQARRVDNIDNPDLTEWHQAFTPVEWRQVGFRAKSVRVSFRRPTARCAGRPVARIHSPTHHQFVPQHRLGAVRGLGRLPHLSVHVRSAFCKRSVAAP